MLVTEYLMKDYPPFHPTDSAAEAYEFAKDFGYTHLFLEKDGLFLGAIPVGCAENLDGDTLESCLPYLEKFALVADASIWDSLKIFHTFDANVVPILSRNEQFLGYLDCADIFAEFTRYPLFSEPGAVLTVQTPNAAYSLTEVAKIVEGNNARLYGTFVTAVQEDSVQITLKFSTENLTGVGETFERYGYTIVHKFYTDEKAELLQDRYDFFQKYLEI